MNYSDNRLVQMEAILSAVEAEDGVFAREPGFLLADLSFVTGIEYKTCSALVLILEAEGFLTVDRYDHDEPRRANRLMRLVLT